ncbi:MAG: hypothetical protein AUJ12_05745 [Alphaproteobacteria bacterium CG1_02_46_17]|nr:MAG: hypothetical protein AUJ12_05745 [Alphaproteobacteria bacterium CG1_02_46_17]
MSEQNKKTKPIASMFDELAKPFVDDDTKTLSFPLMSSSEVFYGDREPSVARKALLVSICESYAGLINGNPRAKLVEDPLEEGRIFLEVDFSGYEPEFWTAYNDSLSFIVQGIREYLFEAEGHEAAVEANFVQPLYSFVRDSAEFLVGDPDPFAALFEGENEIFGLDFHAFAELKDSEEQHSRYELSLLGDNTPYPSLLQHLDDPVLMAVSHLSFMLHQVTEYKNHLNSTIGVDEEFLAMTPVIFSAREWLSVDAYPYVIGRFDERMEQQAGQLAEQSNFASETDMLSGVRIDGKSVLELLAKIAYNNPLNP